MQVFGYERLAWSASEFGKGRFCHRRLADHDPTNPTMESDTFLNGPELWAHQLAGIQMQHLSGAALQGPAHQQHLAAGVDAGQQAALAQPMAEGLLAHRNALHASGLLGHVIAGRRLQEEIAPRDPTDAGALRDPPSTGWLAPPAPHPGRFWHPPPPVRRVLSARLRKAA